MCLSACMCVSLHGGRANPITAPASQQGVEMLPRPGVCESVCVCVGEGVFLWQVVCVIRPKSATKYTWILVINVNTFPLGYANIL